MTVAAFDWSEPLPWAGPGAIDGVVEDLAGDRLGRARYAEFLSNYLAAEGKQRNYVLRKVRTSIPRTKNENFSHLISMGYQ
ncbi:hypothetical protein ACET70_08930 [Aeromonas caviae]|uniref:hypothetical protein n=1 Tax=Aeromonas caviae TaxID=648 RepID=UPI0029D9BF43|nr:hypothetical protein [Aeromonas caviae]MDX7822656.1 hypothetical protein [Aeromonas caviae]